MKLNPVDQAVFFHGRDGDPRLGDVVFHDQKSSTLISSKASYRIGIYGCPDDLGVRLNRGRAGAAGGPDAIRKALYKIVPPHSKTFSSSMVITDHGNISVHASDILATHRQAQEASFHFATHSNTIITLGGGHDFAAPNILGWAEAHMKKKLGLVNIDPHLDVRDLEDGKPHSGTPFRQIMESKLIASSCFTQFGARKSRNAALHWDYCKRQGIRICTFEDLKRKKTITTSFTRELNRLAKVTDVIALTIDLDSCSDISGASAAPAVGFSAWELCEIAYISGKNRQVTFLELAELAPTLDPSGRSANVAAEILYSFILGRSETLKTK
jgi:formiminoglutamase